MFCFLLHDEKTNICCKDDLDMMNDHPLSANSDTETHIPQITHTFTDPLLGSRDYTPPPLTVRSPHLELAFGRWYSSWTMLRQCQTSVWYVFLSISTVVDYLCIKRGAGIILIQSHHHVWIHKYICMNISIMYCDIIWRYSLISIRNRWIVRVLIVDPLW